MHRPSASENPQSPLGHHYQDSTHVTPGVITGGVRAAGLGVEGGIFHGREPDEHRTDLDFGPLDSYAVRLSYLRGAWSAQVSSAWLETPERLSTYDAERLTASISHAFALGAGELAWTAAVAQNREVHGNLEAYLLEGVWRLAGRWARVLARGAGRQGHPRRRLPSRRRRPHPPPIRGGRIHAGRHP